MSEVDQEVPPQNDDVSAASDDGSAAVAAAHVRAEFLDKAPKNAEIYSGMIDTTTFDEWVEHSTLWIDRLRFLDEHRLSAALMLLRGLALSFWRSWQDDIGKAGTWTNFQFTMRFEFQEIDLETRWN